MTTHFPLNMHHCTYNSDNPTAGPQRFFIFHHLGFSRPDSCAPFLRYTYVFSTIALLRGPWCSEILISLGFCAPFLCYTYVFSTIALFRDPWCAEILIFLGFCAPFLCYTYVFSTIALFRGPWCSDPEEGAYPASGSAAPASSSESHMLRSGAYPPGPWLRLAVTCSTEEQNPHSAEALTGPVSILNINAL